MVVGVVGRTLAGLLKSTGPAAGLGVGIGAGSAAGGSAVSVAMMPFNAVNNFLGSGFFGYGMIIGERYAYQNDWPKIQERLEKGEKIFDIMHTYTGTFSAVMMSEAKIIMQDVSTFVHDLMTSFASGASDKGAASTAGIQWFIDMMNEQNDPNFIGPKITDTNPEIFQDDRNIEKAQEELEERLRQKKIDQQNLLKSQEPTNKEIDKIISNAPTSKRKAGQSQLIERRKLIVQIDVLSKNYKRFSPSQRKQNLGIQTLKLMRAAQVKLSQLLTRYQF